MRRTGSRGRQTASIWSSAIRVAPVPRRRSTCTRSRMVERRQLTRPPANLSDIHPVVSPDGRYLAFVRMNRDRAPSAATSFCRSSSSCNCRGNRRQLTFGLSVLAFDWAPDSRSIIHDAGNRWSQDCGESPSPAARPSPCCRTSGQDQALSGALRCRRGLSEHAHRCEHLGIAYAVLPESRTLGGRNFSRYRVDGFRYGHAVLTGWNADAFRLGQVGPQRAMGVETRRISGEQTDKLRGRRASEAGGKPCLECRRQANRIRHSRDDTGKWNLHIVAADGGGPAKPLTSDAFNDVGPSWSIDGQWIRLWIRSHARGRLADLEDAIIRRDCGAGDLWWRQGAGHVVGRPTRLLREGRDPFKASGRYPPKEARKFRSSDGAGRSTSTSQRTESS